MSILALVCLPAAAWAQDGRGVSVGGSVSATSLEARTSLSFAGSFEYRVNRVAGFEVEMTVVPTLRSDFPGARILAEAARPTSIVTGATGSLTTFTTIFPAPRFDDARGRAVIFSNNVRVHIPTTSARVDPYFVAGGGLANVRHRATYIFDLPIRTIPIPIPIPIPAIPPIRQPISSSSTDLALTIGGGVGIRALSSLWIEGDLRLFRLLGDEDRNVGRFGVGVRYRF
jgi:hypothetical protein